ncbi:hypothetical protein ACA910_004120 [Epithemia clementina (nom. ined.)]
MSDPPPRGISEAEFTTNEEDQREAARLKARLEADNTKRRTAATASKYPPATVPHVQIDDGAHKYVLIQAERPGGDLEYFVTSRRGASYHRNAAEPLINQLEAAGYVDIQVTGGGRILWEEELKKISIFGFSYSFGQANHSISKEVIMEDPRFKDCEVTTSNEGY